MTVPQKQSLSPIPTLIHRYYYLLQRLGIFQENYILSLGDIDLYIFDKHGVRKASCRLFFLPDDKFH